MVQSSVVTELTQTPHPGRRLLHHIGDIIEFRLRTVSESDGQAWLRCNLGRAGIRRREIIDARELDQPVLEHDWHDLPMRRIDAVTYSIRLPLLQAGRFQAKAFFLDHNDHRQIMWPPGTNTIIKVEAGGQVAANTIYNAFVRQFGRRQIPDQQADRNEQLAAGLEEQGYNVIPDSGKFRDLIQHLDLIIDKMGFRVIQLLPIHPVPTTYARMGRFGSPFASLDLMDVDPALAVFDRQTTPMDQFLELVKAVHQHGARLFLDLPLNHTGWASSLQIHHPEWFTRDQSRRFRSPGAWGVTWEDLAELDYRQPSLWSYIAEVFLFWCRHGVDGFRCDAGYMLPVEAWQYMVAKVREQYPETTFFLEGLGGKMSTTKKLLDLANLDWAYSELFQNYDRNQIENYLPQSLDISREYGLLVNFAETHDNNRLAAVNRNYARLRTGLTALASINGGFGMANGVEWFATEKIDVHGAPSLNWGNSENMIPWISVINRLLATHPAFFAGVVPRMLPVDGGNAAVILRETGNPEENLLIIVNLDWRRPQEVSWPADTIGDAMLKHTHFFELLSNQPCILGQAGEKMFIKLEAGQVLCLGLPETGPDKKDRSPDNTFSDEIMPARVAEQLLTAQILEIHQFYHSFRDLGEFSAAGFPALFREDPAACCRRLAGGEYPRLLSWHWPEDRNRIAVVPQQHLLLITAGDHFTAEIRERNRSCTGRRRSLRLADGSHALILPVTGNTDRHTKRAQTKELKLLLEVYEATGSSVEEAVLLAPSTEPRTEKIRRVFGRHELAGKEIYALQTNERGTMAQVHGGWGEIRSQYDALLAANLHPAHPTDRQVLFTRCRGWVINRGYSRELDRDSLRQFRQQTDGTVIWEFEVPTGMGKTVPLEIRLSMDRHHNRITLQSRRPSSEQTGGHADRLPDQHKIKIILRPDIEDRLGHEKTKAFTGPEQSWPAAVSPQANGFTFNTGKKHSLSISTSKGDFVYEPEWLYMVPHPLEAERGLDNCSDLFSPGWFGCELKGGREFTLTAEVLSAGETKIPAAVTERRLNNDTAAEQNTLTATLRQAILSFIVKRDTSRTVIAGYPWFLDWGRDTLICLRGIIAAGLQSEAEDILKQFARFENKGTLPNMIRGGDVSNRDTSDAPLWFFIACRDLLENTGSDTFMESKCDGQRTIREVLVSIAENYIKGTDNGIAVDPSSGLVFSPSHFTWMDTNYPAATPRQGYPVEIQALWITALRFLTRIEPENKNWLQLAERASGSLQKLFVTAGQNRLADCLHADFGTPAVAATPDNALRCNQLLAITMGAIVDKGLGRGILESSQHLLVPGAIRSLADRDLTPPLLIHGQGRLLSPPKHPYRGHYLGDEDTSRKPAYHNGTAWTWPFPSYCEAMVMIEGKAAAPTAGALLTGGARHLLESGCIGQLPEIVDGDAPHRQRGCGAQAWAATEYYRVLNRLFYEKHL